MPAPKKLDDDELIRLNSIGLSLTTIGERLGVHYTTVTQRLRFLGIKPADTRRTFMEDIWRSLPKSQQVWLEHQLGPDRSVKDYVRALLTKEYLASKS